MEAPSKRRSREMLLCSSQENRGERGDGGKEGKGEDDGDSREVMARKQRGERDARTQQKTGREGQGDSSEDQAGENEARGDSGSSWGPVSPPQDRAGCRFQPAWLEGADRESGQQRRSFKGRRNPSRFGCRQPGPGAGSVPASGPGRRAGLRSGMGQSSRAAAVSSGS